MVAFIRFADALSAAFGKTFAWLIVLMTFGTSYEVFVRYILNSPTPWAFDVSFIMYGTLFMMGGAQARLDFVLYIFFYFPGVLALVISGWKYASRSWGYGEVSVNSPAGIPIYQFKTVMVAAGLLLVVQGIAQLMRCILCMRDGYWLPPEQDVRETEEILMEKGGDAHI